MICNICKTTSIVFIKKTQSNKEKREDKVIQFAICQKCDPVVASLRFLEDGFQIACQNLKLKIEKNE